MQCISCPASPPSPLPLPDPSSPPPAILVIASRGTRHVVAEVATELGLACLTERTMQAAVAAVMQNRPGQACIQLVISALGSCPETVLFNGKHSDLIEAACAKGIPLCVFSHHASSHPSIQRMCLEAGAATIVNKAKHVRRILDATLGHAQAAAPLPQPSHPLLPPGSTHPLLHRRARWLQHLRLRHGDAHAATQTFLGNTLRLQEMIQATALAGLTCSPAPGHVRFVAVSDTHNQHRSVALPPGEVLLHCGDMTGNYHLTSSTQLLAQLLDVAAWMHTLTQYTRIFITPGNHDTLLDRQSFPKHAQAYEAFVAALPAHASLLLDGGAEHRGLRLWASPVVVDRVEAEGKRYLSSGFERKEVDRRAVWSQLPNDLDVLMTHSPSKGPQGDHLLAEALARLQAPPLVHVFGHCHSGAGCGRALYPGPGAQGARSGTWINAAQDMYLHHEPGVGGAAWVFDLAAKEASRAQASTVGGPMECDS